MFSHITICCKKEFHCKCYVRELLQSKVKGTTSGAGTANPRFLVEFVLLDL